MKNGLDIETIPNESMVAVLPEPEVKLGNIKDAAKIEEKIKEVKQKQIADMALSPLTGRICSFAMYGESENFFQAIPEISDSAEIELITSILNKLVIGNAEGSNIIITWNGNDFDFPYIYKRACILKIPLPNYCPGLRYWIKKYDNLVHHDIMMELCNWNKADRDNLDFVGKVILGEGKTKRDYSEYVNLIKTGQGNQIGLDNLNDAEHTYKIFKTFEPYLF
jgi:DNA polymerase elongation subunit (family B)